MPPKPELNNRQILMENVAILEQMLDPQLLIRKYTLEIMEHQNQILWQQDLEQRSSISNSILCTHVEK